MRISLIITGLFLLPLVACSSDTTDAPTGNDTAAMIEHVEGSNAKGEKRAAEFFAATICMVADPNFWDDFWDDNTPEQAANDAAQMQAFYEKFGYQGENDAMADVQRYAPRTSFGKTVKQEVNRRCSDLVTDDVLDSILAEAQT